jgi:hypothetical protein
MPRDFIEGLVGHVQFPEVELEDVRGSSGRDRDPCGAA